MTFRVGQKVEYIGPAIDGRPLGQITPVPHEVYTVRDNGMCRDVPAIRVFEIVNSPREWGSGFFELWLNKDWFRPLVERKTDISIFTAMLDKARVRA
jgi:hypothetical protein